MTDQLTIDSQTQTPADLLAAIVAAGAAGQTGTPGGGGPPTGDLQGALQARFGADPSLQRLRSRRAQLDDDYAEVLKARKDLAAAVAALNKDEPAREIYPKAGTRRKDLDPQAGENEVTTVWEEHFGMGNPEWAQWKQDTDAAREVVEKYLEGYEPGIAAGSPTAAYKDLQTAETRYRADVNTAERDINSRMQELTDEVTKAQKGGSTGAPTIVQVPVPDKPGWTQPSIYDASLNGGKGGYRPATGADGQPLPQVPPAAETTAAIARAGKPKQGDVTWELKQSGNRWFQVPMVADAQGSWQYDTSRMPQEVSSLRGAANVQVIGGVPYVVGDNGQLTAATGYQKPPIVTTDEKTGQKYYSTDDGKTWTKAQGLPGRPQTLTNEGYVVPLDDEGMPILDKAVRLPEGARTDVQDGYLIRYDPNTKGVERIDLYTPEQRSRFEETAQLGLETRRAELERARVLQDPLAEYQRQVTVTQQQATKYRDDLNQQVLEGRLSVEDASRQFDDWWGTNVEAKLSPYQTMAQTAYRKEQNQYMQAQAAEQARVEAINRQREQTAWQAGEKARADLMTLAPQGRSPEFLGQLAQNVSQMGDRTPGRAPLQFSPESLSLDAVRRSQPSITQVGQQAVARALSQISPAAAQQVGVAPPTPMSVPGMQSFLAKAPFQIPNPALPVPGQEALDLGNPANAARLGLPVQPGFAGTRYQGGNVVPWQIPAA